MRERTAVKVARFVPGREGRSNLSFLFNNEYCLDFGADPVSKTRYITLECMNAVLERV